MASTDDYLSSVSLWAGSFNPRFWTFCYGQLLSISQYNALFSLIGTIYGGDGRVTFGVPDMRGRVPIGEGQSPGTQIYPLGAIGGSEYRVLSLLNLPTHKHTATFSQHQPLTGEVDIEVFNGDGLVGSGNQPDGKYLGPSGSSLNLYYDQPAQNEYLADADVEITGVPGSVVLGNNGGSQGFYITQPYTVLNYIMLVDSGIYPPRN